MARSPIRVQQSAPSAAHQALGTVTGSGGAAPSHRHYAQGHIRGARRLRSV